MHKVLFAFLICVGFATAAPVRAAVFDLESAVHFDGEKYIRTELYFGLSRKNGPNVADEEFDRFVEEFVTPRFPNGLTVIDATGQWREDDSTVTKERSKVLVLIYAKKGRRDAGVKIEQIREEYKKRFAQDSVVRVDMSKSLEVSFE